MILTKFEEIWSSWKTHAELKKLDIFQINHVKSEFFLAFEQLKNCTTNNESQKLTKFLDDNPHIIITESDKSKNINVMPRTDYLKKLNEIFEPNKFKKLKSKPINVDLANYRTMANKLKNHLSDKEGYLINPKESLKRGYGIPKNHKPGIPLRPIVSSINSITVGGEQYLHNLIAPIVKKCKFSLNSTKDFKEKILKIPKFDTNNFEIVTFDCVSLYTSVDLKLVIDKIINTIYENEDNFFKKGSKTVIINKQKITKEIVPPSKFLLKQFLMQFAPTITPLRPLMDFIGKLMVVQWVVN